MKIVCNKLSSNYMSGIVRPNLTFWNVCNSATFLPCLSSAIIIDGHVVTTAIKKQVRLATNRYVIISHIINQEKWMPQILDSIDYDSVDTAMEKEPGANQVRIAKFSHGWLST